MPGGGSVAAGQVGIVTDGTRMNITQGSQRAIINWQSFDIGSQAQVSFQQPNAAAVALNRVSGPTASRIEGQLSANGQVFLVNPNGVLFGGGARVDVGALVASTLEHPRRPTSWPATLASAAAAAPSRTAERSTPRRVAICAFIAPTITNDGTLNAPHGTVAMGAGEAVTLNFAGDRLVGLSVSTTTLDTLIENRQAIHAEGGAILLTAAGAAAVSSSVVNNSGVLEAGSLTEDGGRIVLRAGGDITLGSNFGDRGQRRARRRHRDPGAVRNLAGGWPHRRARDKSDGRVGQSAGRARGAGQCRRGRCLRRNGRWHGAGGRRLPGQECGHPECRTHLRQFRCDHQRRCDRTGGGRPGGGLGR